MKIGFVGLGNMGYNMVNNLLKKGFEVYTYDVFEEAVKRTEAIGAKGVSCLGDLGKKADVILVMVMNFQQVQSVVLGEEGLLEAMDTDKVLVVSSTIAPSQTNEIADMALKKGVHYVDVALNEVPLFIRSGKCIPVAEAAECVKDIDTDRLKMLGYEGSSYTLYEDDGIHKDYDKKENYRVLTK